MEVTDLNQVKAQSKVLFDAVEVELDQYGVVHHPFTHTRIVGLSKDGGFTFGDVTNEGDFKMWRSQLFALIDGVEYVYTLLLYLNKPWLLTWFKLVHSFLSEEDYADCLTWCYTVEEFPNQDVNVSQKELIEYFKAAGCEALLDKSDVSDFKKLPEEITVFRGVSRGDVRGLSWTTDLEKAKWFATRFASRGDSTKVYTSVIKKSDILMYNNCRNEHEVIVDPSKLDIKQIAI